MSREDKLERGLSRLLAWIASRGQVPSFHGSAQQGIDWGCADCVGEHAVDIDGGPTFFTCAYHHAVALLDDHHHELGEAGA